MNTVEEYFTFNIEERVYNLLTTQGTKYSTKSGFELFTIGDLAYDKKKYTSFDLHF